MNKWLSTIILLLAGFAAGYLFVTLSGGEATVAEDAEPEILYWVAPMDPDYRRDKPGQSPMGMDLVPVYAEKKAAKKAEPEILYWVAPMDPNYKRDKPGQSPMGMDLVPVYAEDKSEKAEPKILYWVAPMDPNYRRDEPGQSPMGMDLVPVYDESSSAGDTEGAIRINANVENNIGVRVASVSFEPLQQQIDTVGHVSFDQDKLWHVHPRVEGWIENLSVTAEGDKVKEGTELFSIYSPTLVNAQEEFLTALKRGGRGIIESSKRRLMALGVSTRQIKQIEKTRKASHRVSIYAKFTGYITQLKLREGQYVRPADKIMTVGNIKTVWVMTEVFERQASWLKMGLSASMSTAHAPGRKWLGKIDHIHPFLNPKTRTMRVRLHYDNADEALKPNMFVKVTIDTDSTESVISIPREALIRTGKQDRVVLSLGDGQYKSVAVLPGRESRGAIEIIKGLQQSDTVVTSAHFLLDSESSVTADFSRLTPIDYDNNDNSNTSNNGGH